MNTLRSAIAEIKNANASDKSTDYFSVIDTLHEDIPVVTIATREFIMHDDQASPNTDSVRISVLDRICTSWWKRIGPSKEAYGSHAVSPRRGFFWGVSPFGGHKPAI
jgi:hypothetical protein